MVWRLAADNRSARCPRRVGGTPPPPPAARAAACAPRPTRNRGAHTPSRPRRAVHHTTERAQRREGGGVRWRWRRGVKGGARQSAKKKRNVQLPLVPHQAQPTQRDDAQQGRGNSGKKKKAGRSAKKKTQTARGEGKREDKRERKEKIAARGASHTPGAQRTWSYRASHATKEKERNNTCATNRPQTQLSTDAKNHNNERNWVHPTPRDCRHTGPPTKRSTDATSPPDAAGPPTQNQPSPQRSNRQRPPPPPQPSIYTVIHRRDPQRRNFHRQHPSPTATLAARSTNR